MALTVDTSSQFYNLDRKFGNLTIGGYPRTPIVEGGSTGGENHGSAGRYDQYDIALLNGHDGPNQALTLPGGRKTICNTLSIG